MKQNKITISIFILLTISLVQCQEGGHLRELQGQFYANLDQTTVSGISSGGYMAMQLHVSNSQSIKGIVQIAAGPYWNAKGDEEFGQKACRGHPELIKVQDLVDYAIQASKDGLIDDIKNIRDQPISILSLSNDSTVLPMVSQKSTVFYEKLFANPLSQEVSNCEHSYPTDHFGNIDPLHKGSPFMNICGFNTAHHTFEYLYNRVRDSRGQADINLFTFDQRPYLVEGSGMNDRGFIYVPNSCQYNFEDCYIHIALHGCRQTIDHIGNTFARNTLLNKYAENNNIIILYPQAKIARNNPNGCWDYWGYTGQDYALKSGKQNQSIMNMAQALKVKPEKDNIVKDEI